MLGRSPRTFPFEGEGHEADPVRLLDAGAVRLGLPSISVIEAQREHRAASAAAHRREPRLGAPQTLDERRLVARTDRSATAGAAGLDALERGAARDHVAEAGPLPTPHLLAAGRHLLRVLVRHVGGLVREPHVVVAVDADLVVAGGAARRHERLHGLLVDHLECVVAPEQPAWEPTCPHDPFLYGLTADAARIYVADADVEAWLELVKY